MGKDEHNSSKGKNRLAQTPKNQITDNKYVEFSEDLANHSDKEAQRRAEAANRRMKEDS